MKVQAHAKITVMGKKYKTSFKEKKLTVSIFSFVTVILIEKKQNQK